jgi:hypothetical protein
MATEPEWFIRNIAEVRWRQFPDHSISNTGLVDWSFSW